MKRNKLVCNLCWFVVPMGAWSSPSRPLRCLNYLHSLHSQPQTIIELKAWRGWPPENIV